MPACSSCKRDLPADSFGPHAGRSRRTKCRRCHASHEHARRIAALGLTACAHTRMRIKQQDLCAICGSAEQTRPLVDGTRRLCIDHDHITGRVRGLLCSGCNRAIGLLGDNVQMVDRAAAYLRRA